MPHKRSIIITTILLAYSIYMGFFIYKTSVIVDAKRYFILFDDSMVSMRYAKNLANGYGLVFNPNGDRVEGYTNLFWVIYMALFHKLPIPQSKICLSIQISGAIFMIITCILSYKLAQAVSQSAFLTPILATILCASYYPLTKWAVIGTEVSVLAFLVALSVLLVVKGSKTDKPSIAPYLICGASALIRIDMLVFLVGLTAFLVITDVNNRRRHLLFALISFALFVVPQTIFRLVYYGEILPTTYYLKMTGFPAQLRIVRGFNVAWTFIKEANPFIFAIAFLMLMFWRKSRRYYIIPWLFIVQIPYSVWVGGDAWEDWGGSNRYISVVMPLFFVMLVSGIERLFRLFEELLKQKADKNGFLVGRALSSNWIFGLVVLFCIANLNLWYKKDHLKMWFFLKEPEGVHLNRQHLELALFLKDITTESSKVALPVIGTFSYFSERKVVDLLGKTDKRIAKMYTALKPEELSSKNFYPGHIKWDYAYSIGELKPDVVAFLNVATLWMREDIERYLTGYKLCIFNDFFVFLKLDSKNILWDKVVLRKA